MNQELDASKVEDFAGRVMGDLGAALSSLLVNMGDRLGLYRTMAGSGPLTPTQLARKTGTAPRYVREWLNNQAASGYVIYSPPDRYELPDEHAAVLADETSPTFMGGGFMALAPMFADRDKAEAAFRSGDGIGWGELDARICYSTERFYEPAYRSHLIQDWIPALEGVEPKLAAGGSVADVGCGHGVTTVLLGQAWPEAEVVGFDAHAPSVRTARQRAQEATGVENVRFEVASAKSFPGEGYDLVTFFDCLHDMGDPVGAARHVRRSLAPDGTFMVVEPQAGDRVQENLNPVGRAYYAFSTVVCTPASLAEEVGLGLGAQAGETCLRAVLTEAGFTRIRKAADTPFSMVLEARP